MAERALDTTHFGSYEVPSASQLSGFATFTVPNVSVTDDVTTFKNRLGMYTAKTDSNGDFYCLWLEYEPLFRADGSSAVDEESE